MVMFMLLLPLDAVEYKSAAYTQSLYRLNDRPTLELVKSVDKKWRTSGGLGDAIFTSRKYRSGPRPTYKLALVPVKNSLGFFQNEQGLTRTYSSGARFDDVLYNSDGVVFEHRVREKREKWESRVEYRDVAAYPKGYTGLQETCASCHNQAGTGGYGVGLVPGGDTVISEPMDWSVVNPTWNAE